MAHSDSLDGEFSLYRQVETILRDQIADGVLRPGDRLPSEEALRGHFGVSRGTLRQALDSLGRDGLLERARGRGTFVAEGGKVETRRTSLLLSSLVESASQANCRERAGRALPPRIVSTALEIDSDLEIPFFIRISGSAACEAIGIKRYLVPELTRSADDLAADADFDAALARLGRVVRGAAWVEAILAEPRFAMLLKVPLGSPLLSVWWVDLLDDRPVACSQMLRPGSAISLDLSAEGNPP